MFIFNIDSSTEDNVKWLLFIVLLMLFIYIIFGIDSSKNEGMIDIPNIYDNTDSESDDKNLKWSRTDSCKYYMNKTTYDVLGDNNIKNTNNHEESDIIFPCGYNYIDNEISSLPHVYNESSNKGYKRVFIIEGADEITAKNYLWKNIYNHHGFNRAKQMCPNTYLLTYEQRDADLERLKKDHYPGKLYIMKKNIQRQEGLEITDNIDVIIKNDSGYVLAQELLQDSYLVNKKKINLRVYVAVVCHKSNTDIYIFNDGFMYYTKQDFVKNDKSNDNHITTGYVKRDVYIHNPLTHAEFKRYLDLPEGNRYHKESDPRKLSDLEKSIRNQGFKLSDVIFKRIENLMTDVFVSFKGHICKKILASGKPTPIYNDYTIQLFGADVAINDQLQPQIIEINKGPDLSPKDEKDANVKKQLMHDIFEIIGLTKEISKSNGLIKVLEM